MYKLRYLGFMTWVSILILKAQEYINPIYLGVLITFGIFLFLKAYTMFYKYKAGERILRFRNRREREKVFKIQQNANVLMLDKLNLIQNVLSGKKEKISKANRRKHNACFNKRKIKTCVKANMGNQSFMRNNNPERSRKGTNIILGSNGNAQKTNKKSAMSYSSDFIVNNNALLTPVGSYNRIAENMINAPIYTWSIKDNLTAKSGLNSAKKYKKICLEESCENLMLSDTPIISNLCSKCLNNQGLGSQSMDFFQYMVTEDYPKLEYFCSCLFCRVGNTKYCLEKRCKLCTTPKISLKS